MNKKGILIGLVIVVAIVLVIIALGGKKGVIEDNGDVLENEETVGTETFNPEIPDEDIELTEPKSEAKAAPGSEASLRTFEMTATKDGFDPEEIVVNQGDTVHIDLITDGVSYDIFLPDTGHYQIIEEGDEKVLEFQALSSGTYTYLCRDICPGGKEIKGSLVIKAR
jgi:plastocyanin